MSAETKDAIFADVLTRNLVTDTAISLSGGMVGATVFTGFGKASSDQWSLLCIISSTGNEQEICYKLLTDGLETDTTYIVVKGREGKAFLCCAAVEK
jgi:ABC-type sulfate transport system substrate-binding protein